MPGGELVRGQQLLHGGGNADFQPGGPLVNRSPRPPGTGILTPLGEKLCQQARDYLQPPAPGPDAPPPDSRARTRRVTPGSR